MDNVNMNNLLLLWLFATNYGFFHIASGSDAESNSLNDINSLLIQTSTGPVEGNLVLGLTAKTARVFYGIPYAEPPLGKLRFLPPLPVQPWIETFKATEKPLPCYQFYTRPGIEEHRESKTLISRPWSEDCLTLTIWTPHPVPSDSPVLVLFHSGGFSTGSSTFPNIDGSTLAAEANNVIVSMNYRLGPFGFLSLGVSEAPGNAGLLDQQLALKWIHTNIHQFGGKTKAIILVGTGGAGSASVGYHIIAESSSGLFRTTMLFSGSATCSYAFQPIEKAVKKSKTLTDSLGCSRGVIDKEIQCLREVHPEDIVDAEQIQLEHKADQFKPTVDGTFINERPSLAMDGGRFNRNVTILIAANPDEGSLIYKRINPDVMAEPEKGISIDGFRKSMKRLFPYYPQSALHAIEEVYINPCSIDDPLTLRDAAIRVYSDQLIDCCMTELVDAAAKYGVESYRCIEDIPWSSKPSWIGSPHGMSILYGLGYPLGEEKFGFTSYESQISKEYIAWVAEYTQKKTIEIAKSVSVYNLKDRPYLFWNMTGMFNFNNYRAKQCKLLNEIVPKLKSIQHENCDK